MVFNTFVFAIFLLGALALYWASPPRYRNPVLLIGSYIFYGYWDWRFLSLLAISTIADFVIAQRIASTQRQRRRTQLLVCSAVINLGILAVFKYANFFIDSLSDLTQLLGFGELSSAIKFVLPVGISFYTFQTLSYTFDVYRRRINATRNFIDFATYVSYFPQLVAGPIERAKHLLPQIQSRDRPKPTGERLAAGLILILQGLFKKVVLADGVARIVDGVFADPTTHSWAAVSAGVLAFGIQIYGDFSGYTDIARGVSRLFGIDLVVNFRQPYLARNITEFWRRWHISLSDWLRDYVYVPLGGNRRGRLAMYRNLMLTMLLGGLWHGASWNFVIWGGLHGLWLVAHKLIRGGNVPTERLRITHLPAIILTFFVVHVTWIFFRAESFTVAYEVFRQVVTFSNGATVVGDVILVLFLVLLTFSLDLATRRPEQVPALVRRSPALVGATVAAAVLAIVVFSGGTPQPFIYFQF